MCCHLHPSAVLQVPLHQGAASAPRAQFLNAPLTLLRLQCMIGYLIFASASLLGYSGGFVVMTAFEVFDVRISWPTFVFLMYNFAIVGVVAVFWQKVPGGVHACSHSYTLQCAATGHPARGDAGVLGGRELHHGLDRRQAAGGMRRLCWPPVRWTNFVAVTVDELGFADCACTLRFVRGTDSMRTSARAGGYLSPLDGVTGTLSVLTCLWMCR